MKSQMYVSPFIRRASWLKIEFLQSVTRMVLAGIWIAAEASWDKDFLRFVALAGNSKYQLVITNYNMMIIVSNNRSKYYHFIQSLSDSPGLYDNW